MSLIAELKRKLFRRKLERELALRRPGLVVRPEHPDTARTLAILFPADDANDRKLVEAIKVARRKQGLKTSLLGYFSVPVKENASYNFPFFTVKDLNWYGVPVGKDVDDFLAEKCDLLYVLGQPGNEVMDYLARLKKTGLRVGPYTGSDDADNPYNVQFMSGNSASGVADQLKQISRIFKIINAKTTAVI